MKSLKGIDCPLCDREGSVCLITASRKVWTPDGRIVSYEHNECGCFMCGNRFVPEEIMNGNLERMREAMGTLPHNKDNREP